MTDSVLQLLLIVFSFAFQLAAARSLPVLPPSPCYSSSTELPLPERIGRIGFLGG